MVVEMRGEGYAIVADILDFVLQARRKLDTSCFDRVPVIDDRALSIIKGTRSSVIRRVMLVMQNRRLIFIPCARGKNSVCSRKSHIEDSTKQLDERFAGNFI